MWTDIINDIAQSDARWRPGGCGSGAVVCVGVCVSVYICMCVCVCVGCIGEKKKKGWWRRRWENMGSLI